MPARCEVVYRRAPEGTCFLHIGTHKTGTTSLQNLLAANASTLAKAGTFYPLRGRPANCGGHHNIAWELGGDPRFDPANGTLTDVIDEVRAAGLPRICVSSEDLEFLHDRLDRLRLLRDEFARLGFRVVIIAYLRPQASYAESLYAELVKHDYTRCFDDFLSDIVRDGSIAVGPGWHFTFDYRTLLDDFAAVFGHPNMIVRRYDSGAAEGVLETDFLSIIGAGELAKTCALRRAGRLNTRLRFIDVMRRYHANLRDGRGTAALARHAGRRGFRSRFDPVALPEIARIAQRFAASNAVVFERYGVAIPFVSRRDLWDDVRANLGFAPGGNARRRFLREHSSAAEAAAVSVTAGA